MNARVLMGLAWAVALANVAASAADSDNDVTKFDTRMAVDSSVVSNGVKWIDGTRLPIEGRPFDDVEHYYDRLPANVTTNVNKGVRFMKHYTAGMQFRFSTDSRHLQMRWVPYERRLALDNMTQIAVSGLDVYRFDREAKAWRFVRTGRIAKADGGVLKMDWTPGDECLVNLPLYNGLKSFALGIDTNATVRALPPRANGRTRPVVFYGTSITHGASASRPGLAFVNLVGRDLDVPVVNLGFSGSGRMELEMSEHIARIDADCYVLDCLWNMNDELVAANYEPFIRDLRARRPDTPIVMAETCDVFMADKAKKDRFIRALYEKLTAEGWKDLVYLPKEGMYMGDCEGTVDGCHPNDWGMMSMARAFGKAIHEALHLK